MLKKNIAICYIDKPHNRRGTELQVTVRGKTRPAAVSYTHLTLPTN